MAARTPPPQQGIPIVPGLPIPGLPVPSIPIPGIPGLPHAPHIPNPFSALSTTEKLIVKLLDPHTYVRMGEVAVGIVLLGIGAFAMLNTNHRVEKSATTIVRTGSNVVPAGKAANASSKAAKAAPLTRK